MRLWRAVVVAVAILGVSTIAFAGDLQQSGDKAAQEEARAKPTRIDNAYLIPGTTLFVAGMAMAVYGFLHTGGGDFVSGQVTKESKTGLGAAGLGVAALGGATLYFGAQHAKAASVPVGAGRITVAKRWTW
jgi:Na+/H+ antiporter NhaD/arsenite permease-like protein